MYCTTHRRNCFAGTSLSSSCRRDSRVIEACKNVDEDETGEYDNEDTPDTMRIEQEEKVMMAIADLYVPSHLTKHRIVRRGRGPIQLQFMVEWHPGWTSDRSLARSVIRKHPSEDLFFVEYRSSWEPYTDYYDTITPDMVTEYKNKNDIEQFGSGIDQKIKALSKKDRRSLVGQDMYPNYQFEYLEASEDEFDDSSTDDGELVPPPLKKPRGRPNKHKLPKQRRVIPEQNPECGCSLVCRNNFDGAYRAKIRVEFDALTSFATRSTWLSSIVELTPCP
jgi:hypothetical protein